MRSTLHQFLAAAAVGCIAASGCATHRTEAPTAWHNSGFHPEVPAKPFGSYEAAFRHIALREGLPDDRHTLFRLAADSTLERAHSPLTGDLVVVRAEYYGQSPFGIRGAQGQGRYYAFQIRDDAWKLVGIFHGNAYRYDSVGGTLRVITRWHMSAFESPEIVYTWKGELFE